MASGPCGERRLVVHFKPVMPASTSALFNYFVFDRKVFDEEDPTVFDMVKVFDLRIWAVFPISSCPTLTGCVSVYEETAAMHIFRHTHSDRPGLTATCLPPLTLYRYMDATAPNLLQPPQPPADSLQPPTDPPQHPSDEDEMEFEEVD